MSVLVLVLVVGAPFEGGAEHTPEVPRVPCIVVELSLLTGILALSRWKE